MALTARLDRLDRLRAAVAGSEADVVALAEPANLRYFLGQQLDSQERITVLLAARDHVAVVLPAFDAPHFRAASGIESVYGWNDDRGPDAALREAFVHLSGSVSTIALDEGMPFRFSQRLSASEPRAQLVSADPLLTPLRLVKDAGEVEAITGVGRLVSSAIEHAWNTVDVGMTEIAMKKSIEHFLLDGGADTLDFVLVQAGSNAASPHHVADRTTIAPGHAVLVDIAVTAGGYSADITRQLHIGQPSQEYADAYAVVLAAHEAGVSAVRDGATAADVAAACHRVMGESPFRDYTLPRIGHGIGTEIHEAPSLVAGDATPLTQGVVFTVEPGLYAAGRFGIRIEDTVVVSGCKARRLTGGDRTLRVWG